MTNRPVLRAHFHAEVVDEDEVVYLISERDRFHLKGALLCLLVPLLDGSLTVAEIVDRLSPIVSGERVEAALASLYAKGFVEDAAPGRDAEAAAFWNFRGLDSNVAAARLAAIGIAIRCVGAVSAGDLPEKLGKAGAVLREDGGIVLVLADDYLRPELAALNEEFLSTRRPWLLAKPVGGILWLGPLFVPGETGCWECLARRLGDNRELETLLGLQLGREEPFPVSKDMPALVRGCFLDLAASHLLAAAVDPGGSVLKSRIVTFDADRLTAEKHVLTRRPQCPSCGDPAPAEKRPIRLQPREKRFTADGGHRVCSPAETLERFKDQISPVTGVVGEVKTAYKDPSGLIHIYAGVHKVQASPNLAGILSAFRSNSTGKGRGEAQSKASALCEAVERGSASYRDAVPDARMPAAEMKEPHVALNDCMLISEKQYRDRGTWNRERLVMDMIPAPLDPERPIDWTSVWSLSEERFAYVPTAYCYLGYRDPRDHGEPYYFTDSNGLAAGNVTEEAVLQGFLEVVERDSTSIFWYNKLRRPRVDLESFGDAYFDALVDHYGREGRDLWVLDVTTDLKIPTFIAVSAEHGPRGGSILLGAGSHFDVGIALSRALTEMNQGLYLLDREKSGFRASDRRGEALSEWLAKETLAENAFLLPDLSLEETSVHTHPRVFRRDLRDDVAACVETARQAGLEVLVHDLTRPDVGMSVVKVIVPGLRQLRPRFAPGRLYDVPVAMGWLDAPLPEERMNPRGWLW